MHFLGIVTTCSFRQSREWKAWHLARHIILAAWGSASVKCSLTLAYSDLSLMTVGLDTCLSIGRLRFNHDTFSHSSPPHFFLGSFDVLNQASCWLPLQLGSGGTCWRCGELANCTPRSNSTAGGFPASTVQLIFAQNVGPWIRIHGPTTSQGKDSPFRSFWWKEKGLSTARCINFPCLFFWTFASSVALFQFKNRSKCRDLVINCGGNERWKAVAKVGTG